MLLCLLMPMSSGCQGTAAKGVSVFTILLLFHFNSIPKSQKVSWPNVNDFSITLRTTYILYLLYLLFVLFGIMYSSAVVFLCGGGGDTSHFIIANQLFFCFETEPFFHALWVCSNFLRFNATLSRIHLIVVIDALCAHRTVAQTIPVVCNVAQPTILFTINSCFNPIRQAAVVVIVFSPSYLFCIVVFHVSKTHTHSLAVSAHCHLVCKIKVPTIYITLNDSY